MIKAIVAMAENRVIGNAGTIPWHLPEDFKFFKATTMGHAILMGRKTYESIGKPLPGRENIVLSRTMPETSGVTVIRSLDELKEPTDGRDLFVIGGEEIYRLMLPKVQELYVTRVRKKVNGDTFFPKFMSDFDDGEKILETSDFSTFLYRRLPGSKSSDSHHIFGTRRTRLTKVQNDAFCKVLRFHNRSLFLLIILFGTFSVGGEKVLMLLGRPLANDLSLGWIIFCAVMTGLGGWYVFRKEAQLCKILEFMCPFCNRPLYRERESSGALVRGECSSCRKYIGVEGAEHRAINLSDFDKEECD